MSSPEQIQLRFSDAYEAHARLWLPEKTRGGILYLHGIQSHGGWFEGSASHLAAQGFAVLLPDRRGSGRNERDRGHTPDARRLLEDAVECLNELQRRTGGESSHVVGVSWGGKLALALWRFAPARVCSLALVAPGLFPLVDLPIMQKVRVGLTVLAAPRTLFDIPLNDPELFTANPLRQQFIRDDPLKLERVTTSFLMASRRLDRYASVVKREPDGCPLRVFLAGRDRIIDNARTKDFIRRLRWPNRTIVQYSNAHHTLEFETDASRYWSDLLGFVVAPAS